MASLVEEWRQEAALYRRRGMSAQADMAESYAAQLEARVREEALEALTLEQAAEESGYTYSALEKAIRAGRLENVGGRGSPRVRRGDLPRKGGSRPSGPGLADTILLGKLG